MIPETKLRDPEKRVAFGQQATAIFPNGDSLDTLACAYALSGDFATAIWTKENAMNDGWAPQGSDLSGNLNLLKAHQQCQEPEFGRDRNSFRQVAIASPSVQTKAGDEILVKR